jgi:hypothetical protein
MKTTAKKFSAIGLIGALATFAALVTAQPADAGPRHQSCQTAYNAQANPVYGFGPRVCVQPTDVVAGNRIIGRDPDPFIRSQLLRAYNSGYPD